jgi:hypothetical protein
VISKTVSRTAEGKPMDFVFIFLIFYPDSFRKSLRESKNKDQKVNQYVNKNTLNNFAVELFLNVYTKASCQFKGTM